MTTPLHIVAVMPLWQRHALTALVLRQWHRQIHRLRGVVDLHLVCVGSEGARSSGLVSGYTDVMSYLEADNTPLNQKWQRGVDVARTLAPDAVMLVNSDDVVSDSLVLGLQERLRDGIPFVGLRDLYFFDAPTLRLGYWPGYGPEGGLPHRAGEPIGCARCVQRAALETTGWRLWDELPARNNALDGTSTAFLARHGITPTTYRLDELGHGAKAVDIKTDVGITDFGRIPCTRMVQGAEALAYFADLVDEAALQELGTRWRAVA